MRNSVLTCDKRKSCRVFSFSKNISLHIDRLKSLIEKENFTEYDIDKVVEEVKALSMKKDDEAKNFIENHLLDFRKEVLWYSSDASWIIPVGLKEIGHEVRLESVKMLEKIGDSNSIPKLMVALEDCGDKEKEFFDIQWRTYRSGDDIRELAAKVIKKLETTLNKNLN